MASHRPYRLMLSGGGTGGHIFPAIAIANEFKTRHADAEILFVGAEGKMEMTKVPEAGYKIQGLAISGLKRSLSLSNLLLPFKLFNAYKKAKVILKDFKPDVVIGTGGYVSGPLMMAAVREKVPTLLQEQNSYAGLTNKRLASGANRICVAYRGMEKYFPKNKIVFTGNPVRNDIQAGSRELAIRSTGLENNRRTVLVLGGSLGSRTINESILAGVSKLSDAGVQVIWQCGKGYLEEFKSRTASLDMKRVKVYDFLRYMHLAYAAADVVVSRAGALSISELCIVGKPVVLVPSPNVAEDHQTKNAKALVDADAALMVSDADATETLVEAVLKLIYDDQRCAELSKNMKTLAKPNATNDIVNELEKLIGATK